MKKILITLIMAALLLTACSSLGPATGSTTTGTEGKNTTTQATTQGTVENTAEKDTVADYFPMAADTYMKYKGEGNEYASFVTYVDYVKDNTMQIRKNNGGTEMVLVYTIKDGAVINTFSRGETYYRYNYTSTVNKNEVLLKEPLKTGTSWTLEDGTKRSITAVNVQLETPAGKYTAIEVTTEHKDSIVKEYYGKGAGLVKTVFMSSDNSMTVDSELEKVEKDVPFTHKVRFYFPQFEKDRLVYIDREVAVKSNQEMKWQFQKELKTLPKTGGLTAVLTKNTQVLDITLDDEKDTVTVNLSGDFIKETNAGTSLEAMLINSLANTFGTYYMRNNVIITIDGKPYESGHILMEPGEAFQVKTEGIEEFK